MQNINSFPTSLNFSERDFLTFNLIAKYGLKEALKRIREINEPGYLSYNGLLYKIKSLVNKRLIRLTPIIDIRKLGLGMFVLKAKVNMKYASLFEEILEKNEPLPTVYHSRVYGTSNYIAMFDVPFMYRNDFLEVIKEIERIGLLESAEVLEVDETVYPILSSEWYDFKTNSIVFKWEDLKKDIIMRRERLPLLEEIKKSRHFPELDHKDLLILAKIQLSSFVKFTEIAKSINMKAHDVRYHYKEHIIPNDIILKYAIHTNCFLNSGQAGFYFSWIRFKDVVSRRAFIDASRNRLFIHNFRLIGSKELLIEFELPYNGILGFNRLMWSLAEEDIVDNYELALADINTAKSFVIPYHLFKDGRWTFPKEDILRTIYNLLAVRKITL